MIRMPCVRARVHEPPYRRAPCAQPHVQMRYKRFYGMHMHLCRGLVCDLSKHLEVSHSDQLRAEADIDAFDRRVCENGFVVE